MPAGMWFVGDNQTGGITALINPAGATNGYQPIPPGSASDQAQFLKAAQANKTASSPSTISVENISWYNVQGPYATEAQAKAAIPGIQAKAAAPGEVSQIAQGQGPLAAAAQAAGTISNPLDYLADVGDFFHRLTEKAFWERAGEVLAGVIILYIGIKSLTEGTPVGQAASKTKGKVKEAVTAAILAPK
jgi:hypothetical protein